MVRAALSKLTRILRLGVVLEQRRVGQRLEAQLVAGVGGVRDQLAQEDLLVAVQGVDHQVQQLLDLGLEAEGFLGGGGVGHESLLRSVCVPPSMGMHEPISRARTPQTLGAAGARHLLQGKAQAEQLAILPMGAFSAMPTRTPSEVSAPGSTSPGRFAQLPEQGRELWLPP